MPYFIQNAFLNKFQLQSSNYGNIQDFDGTKGIIGLTPEESAGTFTTTYTLGSTTINYVPIFANSWPSGTDTNSIEGIKELIGTSDAQGSFGSLVDITINTTEGAIGTTITGISSRNYLVISAGVYGGLNGVNTVWKLNTDTNNILSVIKVYDNSANPTIWNPLIATENGSGYIPI